MYLLIGADAQQEASLTLYKPPSTLPVAEQKWSVDRDLAQTLLARILSFLKEQNLELGDLSGLGVFAGPAAFTNLRVTHTIANTLAYSLEISVVNAADPNWQQRCYQALSDGRNQRLIKPDYGLPPTTTKRRR